MTKDFRNVGRLPVEPSSPLVAEQRDKNQRLVLVVIQISALFFLLVGLWLLSDMPSPIPPEVSTLVGFAFVVSAIIDVVVVKLLRRVWSKQAGR